MTVGLAVWLLLLLAALLVSDRAGRRVRPAFAGWRRRPAEARTEPGSSAPAYGTPPAPAGSGIGWLTGFNLSRLPPVLGLTGTGAEGAARTLVLAALTAADDITVVMAPEDALRLLGTKEDLAIERLVVTSTFAEALRHVDGRLLPHRGRTSPNRLLLVGTPGGERDRVAALGRRVPGDAHAVMLADMDAGTAEFDAVGRGRIPEKLRDALPGEVPVLTAEGARARLANLSP